MTTCAIVLKSRRDRVDGILMLLDERGEAEDVAFELRRRGQDVEVVEVDPAGLVPADGDAPTEGLASGGATTG